MRDCFEYSVFSEQSICIKECGDNALEELYSLAHGAVYSDYAVILFEMKKVLVCSGERKSNR